MLAPLARRRRCILTPNMAELGRLAAGVGMPLEGPIATAWQRHLPELAQRFSGVTIVSKGPVDLIADGSGLVLTCDVPSSPRRAGGQGDVLAGATAAFMAWSSKRAAAAAPAGSGGGDGSQSGGSSTDFSNPMMVAAYAGCTVTRTASVLAFKEQRRAMLAGDVISHLGASFASLFGE